MASAVRKLTGVGGDIRKIARLLQKEAPPGHMLAYINQEEADLLKARGGSGKPHADTGVPSFQEEYTDFDMTSLPPAAPYTPYEGADATAAPPAEPFDVSAYRQAMPDATRAYESSVSAGESAPFNARDQAANRTFESFRSAGEDIDTSQLQAAQAARDQGIINAASQFGPQEAIPGGSQKPTAENQTTVSEDVKNWWKTLKPDTKARLGIGGVQSIIGAYQVSQAMEQAKKYREDMAKLAQPYQEQGKKLIAQAQSGELTPAAQQQLQAAQAQAAQGAEKRGGVGAQQAQMAVENMRQQLLQNQYDYGLKVSGIGDSIATGAIRTGMDADRYVNQLASNYANNIARTLSNAPTYVTSYSQNT
jgi:hypothetical protein